MQARDVQKVVAQGVPPGEKRQIVTFDVADYTSGDPVVMMDRWLCMAVLAVTDRLIWLCTDNIVSGHIVRTELQLRNDCAVGLGSCKSVDRLGSSWPVDWLAGLHSQNVCLCLAAHVARFLTAQLVIVLELTCQQSQSV